jgi:hypothetical protein
MAHELLYELMARSRATEEHFTASMRTIAMTRTRKSPLLSSAVSFLLIMLGLMSMPALAKSLPAQAGEAENPVDTNCFVPFYGAVQNRCNTIRQYTVPLHSDGGGVWYRATVTAYGTSLSSTVGCVVGGTDITTQSRWSSSLTYLSQFGVHQSYSIDTYVPPFGAVWVTCLIGPGAWLDTIHWDPL